MIYCVVVKLHIITNYLEIKSFYCVLCYLRRQRSLTSPALPQK